MDAHYNIDAATKCLRTLMGDNAKNDSCQLAKFKNIDHIIPILNEKPTCWKLTIPTSDATQSEELVMSMRGVIVGKDLPPILKRPNERQQPYLRQSVQLTGFDCDEFHVCIETIRSLHQTLARQVSEGAMEPFVSSQFGRFEAVEFSTRYFTSRRDNPCGIATPFDTFTDRNGILAGMSNDKYFHSEDNEVLYYALRYDNEGLPRFLKVDPTQFRVGDIVEVQITVVAVPIRNGKYKMIAQLRSLALLDGSFTDANTESSKYSNHQTAIKPTIKRKVGYNTLEDEMSKARQKMIDMRMNDQ